MFRSETIGTMSTMKILTGEHIIDGALTFILNMEVCQVKGDFDYKNQFHDKDLKFKLIIVS